jgi:F0F1-type ATP synthase delta subunit
MARRTSPPIPQTPESIAAQIIDQLIRAEDLDQLHLSLQQLQHDIRDEAFSLCIDRPAATSASIVKSLDRLIGELGSSILQQHLRGALNSVGPLFFREPNLRALCELIDTAARSCSVIKLTTAITLHEADVLAARNILRERTNEPVVVHLKVEPGLVAGAIVQHATYVTDASVRSNLEEFSKSWQRAVLEQH